jgi:hypothetical protein
MAKTESNQASKNRAFYTSKLASTIIEAITDVSNSMGKTDQGELRRWKDLANEVKGGIRAVPKAEFIPAKKEAHTRTHLTQYEKTL